MQRFIVVLCLLVGGSLARAAPVDNAVAAYRRGDFPKAQKILSAQLSSGTLTGKERARARAYLGASYVHLKDPAAARAQFEALYAESPDASLDEGEFPPKVLAIANDARPRIEVAAVEPAAPAVTPAAPDAGVPAKAKRGEGPIRLAAFEMRFADVSEKKGEFFAESLQQALLRRGMQVTTRGDISALLGLERQKELLGCNDDSVSCLAEIGHALGVDGILSGSIARVDERLHVTLKVLDPTNGKALALWDGRAGSEGQLIDLLGTGAADLDRQLRAALGRQSVQAPAAVVVEEDGASGTGAWIPLAAGAACAAGSVATYLMASGKAEEVRRLSSTDDFNARQGALNGSARTLQTASFALGGAALVSVGVAAVMFASSGEETVALLPVVGPGGGGLAVGGTF